MSKFTKLVKSQMVTFFEGEVEIDPFNLIIHNWPQEDGEELDLENFDVIDIRENEMDFIAGGDWQKGALLTIALENEQLTVTNVSRDIDWTKLKRLDYDEIIEALNIL